MKQLMILLLLLGGSAISVQAQTTGSNSTNGPTHSSEGKTKKNKQKKAGLNHRRNYNWNTGQQATPTGQEATGVGSGYSSIRKDTSGKRDSSTNNQ